jgi:hypothetical protein
VPDPNMTPRPPGNLILAFLPPEEHDRIRPRLQPVELAQGDVLYEANVPVDHVYFMDQGMISVVSIMRNGASIEVGTIGNEGMAGLSVILGVGAVPYRHIVQVAGKARRMSAASLVAELKPEPAQPLSRRLQHSGDAGYGLQRPAFHRAAMLQMAIDDAGPPWLARAEHHA